MKQCLCQNQMHNKLAPTKYIKCVLHFSKQLWFIMLHEQHE